MIFIFMLTNMFHLHKMKTVFRFGGCPLINAGAFSSMEQAGFQED